MSERIKEVLKWFLKPFACDLWRFVAIWYCVSAGICYHQPTISLVAYYGLIGCYITYVVLLLYHSLGGRTQQIFWIVALSAGIMSLFVDVVVAETTGASFNIEHVTLILGTNLAEGEEFFHSYFNSRLIQTILLIFFVGSILASLARLIDFARWRWFAASGVLIFLCGAAFVTSVLKNEEWERFYIFKIGPFLSYEPAPDLTQYRQTPCVTYVDGDRMAPENIFVIIGESFSRNHSSIYGYEKETNPLLSKRLREEKDNFFVFSNVTSSSTKTYYAFELMMTAASKVSLGTDEWIADLKLFDITSQSEYQTAWISNQSKVGMYDNVVTSIAQLSDTTLWAGTSNSGYYKKDYDELLIPMLESYMHNASCEKNVVILHMLGSHPNYYARYPVSYNVYKTDDYLALPGHQREKVAQYDNSILYNDYVISSLIDVVEDMDAVVIYFPDHGQDVYVSDSYYAGHAKDGDSISVKAATEIPFFVYVTDKYYTRNPEFLNRIKANVDRPYCTENIMYTIADLMGIESINGETIGDKSIFYVSK